MEIVVKSWHQFVFHIAAGLSSTSASPATERSDDRAPRNWRHKTPKKRDHNQATRSRLRDLLEWLEDLTENLEIAEVPAPAEISHHSDPERPINEASRKHSIFIQFPKDLNYGVCKRTKITKAPCRRRTGEAAPREKMLVTS